MLSDRTPGALNLTADRAGVSWAGHRSPVGTGHDTFDGLGSIARCIKRERLDRVDNELVITTWSPIHLRTKLTELYWKKDQPSTKAMAFWEDTLRYLFLPRLKNRDVLAHAIQSGAKSRDFFGTAYGQSGEIFDGFQFGNAGVQSMTPCY